MALGVRVMQSQEVVQGEISSVCLVSHAAQTLTVASMPPFDVISKVGAGRPLWSRLATHSEDPMSEPPHMASQRRDVVLHRRGTGRTGVHAATRFRRTRKDRRHACHRLHPKRESHLDWKERHQTHVDQKCDRNRHSKQIREVALEPHRIPATRSIGQGCRDHKSPISKGKNRGRSLLFSGSKAAIVCGPVKTRRT